MAGGVSNSIFTYHDRCLLEILVREYVDACTVEEDVHVQLNFRRNRCTAWWRNGLEEMTYSRKIFTWPGHSSFQNGVAFVSHFDLGKL